MKLSVHIPLSEPRATRTRIRAVALLASACLAIVAPAAHAAISRPTITPTPAESPQSVTSAGTGSSLESAAAKAGSTGRTVAMSLIGLAFAIAAIALAFKRDFKEAAGVFAVGIVCVMLATPIGVSVLRDTVNSLFGSR
jgi:glucose uptake protein GlcU